ncbi:MAG: ribosomal protein S18-alanine N-acetyltransferase [Thermoanaerobaculia bacterium]|nr:ribosomal protein S18-alanine N-acetyltransferase [Thermoanaerobaculia bacterium]
MYRAESRDAERLAALEWEVFGDGAWSQDSLRLLIADGALILAEAEDGILVAYAAFRSVVDEAELLRLAVHPESRRRGLARELLQYAFEELNTEGVSTCHLEVRTDNSAALHLYEDLGFEPVGLRRSYYADGCDAALLSRTLDRFESSPDGVA